MATNKSIRDEQLAEIGAMVNAALLSAAEVKAPAPVLDALLDALRALEEANRRPASLN